MDDCSLSIPRKRSRKELSVLRRANEGAMIQEMAMCLPISPSEKNRASQSALLRMALSYLRTRELMSGFPMGKALFGLDPTKDFPGFVMIVDLKGRIVYATNAITDLVGPNVVDVVGQPVEDLIHAEDQEHVSHAIDLRHLGRRNIFVVRMKKTMASTVRSQELVEYESVFVTSHLKRFKSSSSLEQENSVAAVMLCKTQVHVGFPEIVMGAYVDLVMDHRKQRFCNVDPKVPWLLGFSEHDITNHGPDIFKHPSLCNEDKAQEMHYMIHTILLREGVLTVPRRRIMSGWGQWLWCTSTLKLAKAVNNEVAIVSGRMYLLGPDESEHCLPAFQPVGIKQHIHTPNHGQPLHATQHGQTQQQVNTTRQDLEKDVDEIMFNLLATPSPPLGSLGTTLSTSTTSLCSNNSSSSTEYPSRWCPHSSVTDASESSGCFSVGSSTSAEFTSSPPPPPPEQTPSPPENSHRSSVTTSTESFGIFTDLSSSTSFGSLSHAVPDAVAISQHAFPDSVVPSDPAAALYDSVLSLLV